LAYENYSTKKNFVYLFNCFHQKKFFPYDLDHQQHARRKLFGEDTIAEKVGSYISTALNLKTLAQQKLIDYFAFNLHETTEDQNLNAEGRM